MNRMALSGLSANRGRQRGVATLFVAIILLVILTLIVLASTNVAFFEQRTSNNENRSRLAEQAAEYSLNLAGEYLKGKRNLLISNTAGTAGAIAETGGWLSTDASTGRKWKACTNSIPTCLAEANATRRATMYYYTEDDSTDSELPYTGLLPSAAKLETAAVGVGGASKFATTTHIHALLCRIDSSLSTPACRLNPVSGNRIAVTLVASADLGGENASATVKETWATYSGSGAASAAPIVASGSFNGNGDVTVVTAPNGGGYGLPVSFWSAADVQVEDTTGGGTASITSCYIEYFMGGSPGTQDIEDAKATCPQNGSSPPCHCPKSKDEPDGWLSGHPSGGNRRENIDVLDRDLNACDPSKGIPCTPDIQFYPGGGYANPITQSPATPIALDVSGVQDDDSLFEWIFGIPYVVADHDAYGNTLQNCGSGSQDCADYALRTDLGATVVANCSGINSASSGLYYVTGDCSISGQAGANGSPVILVVFGNADLGSNSVLYGMLFLHDTHVWAASIASCPSSCKFTMNGGTVFGSIVIEGNVKMAGNPVIVYDDISVNRNPNTLPPSAKFARVTGSWLDNRNGF